MEIFQGSSMKATGTLSTLEEITMHRLDRRGVESNNHQAYIRDLVNSYTSCANPTIQGLNEQMNSLGWNGIELDDHTLQLVMAISENNKRDFTSALAEGNI